MNAYIYVEWNEPSSDDPLLWYRCSVTEYVPTKLIIALYPNGNTESVDLNAVQWYLATGNSRQILARDCTPLSAKVPKVRTQFINTKFFTSSPHKTKTYCDDLAVPHLHQPEIKSMSPLLASLTPTVKTWTST